MKRWMWVVWSVFAMLLLFEKPSRGEEKTNCSVVDIQYVQYSGGAQFVFSACSIWWRAPTDAEGGQQVASLIMAAAVSNKKINVQCATNGTTSCTTISTKVFQGGAITSGTKTIKLAETVNLKDP